MQGIKIALANEDYKKAEKNYKKLTKLYDSLNQERKRQLYGKIFGFYTELRALKFKKRFKNYLKERRKKF